MPEFKKLFKSPHIHISLAAGSSIIILAYVSKRVLPEPIGYLPLAIPPFLATIYESVLSKHEGKRICTTWYWVVAILIATALVIAFHAL
jgi:hypothetical protein